MLSRLLLKIPQLRQVRPLMKFEVSRHMAPAFFIVGFQKCGTSTLYDLINQHPRVISGSVKENNILAERAQRLEEFKLCFPKKRRGYITGDASHLHTWAPWGLERIKTHFQEAKLLVIMRDPIKRAFSHYNMERRIGYIPNSMSIEQYIEIEMVLRKNIANEKDPDDTYKQLKFYGNRYGFVLSRGIYGDYIAKLERLDLPYMPIFLEELSSDFEQVSHSIQSYLGLEYFEPEPVVKNKGNYQSTLKEETKEWLQDFYKPHDDRLEEMLGRKLPWR